MLALIGAGSTVSQLTLRLPVGSWTGVQTNGTVRDVDVTTLDPGAGAQVGGSFTFAPGATTGWFGGSIALAAGIGSQSGIETTAAALSLVVQDVAITAEDTGITASDGILTLRRVSLRSGIGYVGSGEHASVDNIAFNQAHSGTSAIGFFVTPSASNDAVLDADHVSARGNGASGSYGLVVSSSGSATAATATVRNSIIRDFNVTVSRATSGVARVANVNLSYTDVDLVHSLSQNAGGGSGAITTGAGVIDENPHWVDAPGGNLNVPASSAVVDAGEPGAVGAGQSSTDVVGNPRIANGRTDLGAIEFQPPALPAPAPLPAAAPLPDTTAPSVAITGLKAKLTLKRLLKGASFSRRV